MLDETRRPHRQRVATSREKKDWQRVRARSRTTGAARDAQKHALAQPFKSAPAMSNGEARWCPVRLRVAITEADGDAGQQEKGKGGRHVAPTVTSATPPPRQSFFCSR